LKPKHFATRKPDALLRTITSWQAADATAQAVLVSADQELVCTMSERADEKLRGFLADQGLAA
jgi:hypothetical protein